MRSIRPFGVVGCTCRMDPKTCAASWARSGRCLAYTTLRRFCHRQTRGGQGLVAAVANVWHESSAGHESSIWQLDRPIDKLCFILPLHLPSTSPARAAYQRAMGNDGNGRCLFANLPAKKTYVLFCSISSVLCSFSSVTKRQRTSPCSALLALALW